MAELTKNYAETALDFLELSAEIVEAYVSRNTLAPGELPGLIESVHGAVLALTRAKDPAAEKPVPPVQIRKTVTPDYIISLEDGRRYQTLRRHLSSRGMTPDDYRARWGLPPDYPMTAANYRARRSELARSLGLGQSRAKKAADKDRSGGRSRGKSPDA